MAKYEVPEHLLDKLKCSLCYEYLSYPPILNYTKLGSVCGRCPALEMEKGESPVREESYECIGRGMLTFPCRYRLQGCHETLPMDGMANHEENCSFKPFFCPILPLGNCPWQGAIEELHAHFAGIHQDHLLEEPYFETDLINNYNINYLIPIDMDLFLLRVQFNSSENLLRYTAHYLGPPNFAQHYTYDLLFSSNNNVCTHKVRKLRVNTCLDMMTRENEHVLNVIELRDILYNPSNIYCRVRFTKVTNEIQVLQTVASLQEEDEDIVNIPTQLERVADKLLMDMECPVCQDYMIPPIYMCMKGHSVCGECKPKLRECPTCRGQMADTRNYTLEKITENIPYACRNRAEGCTYMANSISIRSHENECRFAPQNCPLSSFLQCDWLGHSKKLMKHVSDEHPDYIQRSCFFLLQYNKAASSYEQQQIMEIYKGIFRIHYSYSNANQNVVVAVQYIGTSEEACQFMYETYVIDLNKTNLQLMSKKYCGSINDNKDDPKHCTLWNLPMVLPFMSRENVIQIKCKILKL